MRTGPSIGQLVCERGDKAQPRHRLLRGCAAPRRAERRRPHALQKVAAAGFTILELIMVIGVLSVLLSVVLPTIKTVHAAVLRKRAQAEATVLAQAAIRYKNEYGFWPGQLEVNADDTVRLDPDHASYKSQAGFIAAIISGPKSFTDSLTASATPVPLNENEVYRAFRRVGRLEGQRFSPNPLNPKGLHFLDLADENDADRVSFLDPWGRSYVLFMGLNPRSTFTQTVTPQGGGAPAFTLSVSNAIAFAFSYGPDGDRSTNYIFSAGVRP